MNLTNFNDDISVLKQYVTLRHEKEEASIISISSFVRGESKTTLSLELATSLARDNYKTLLIDLDLYSPGIAKLLGIKDEYGITDYVGKIKTKENTIIKLERNLDLILTGSDIRHIENFLISSLLSNTILDLSRDYDMVIINNSPFLTLNDVEGPSNYTDAAILCIAQEFDSKKELTKVKRYIDQASLNLIGIVMTSAKNKNHSKQNSSALEKVIFEDNNAFKDDNKLKEKKNIGRIEISPKQKSSLETKKKEVNKTKAANDDNLSKIKTGLAKIKTDKSITAKPTKTKQKTKKVTTKKVTKKVKPKKQEKKVKSLKPKKQVVAKKVKAVKKVQPKKVTKPVKKAKVQKKVVTKKTLVKNINVNKNKVVKKESPVLSQKDRIKAALASQKLKAKLKK